MKWIVGLSTCAVSAALALPGSAQRAPALRIAPLAGTMLFGDMVRGPIGTSLSLGTAPLIGAQVAVSVAGPLALYGSAGFARSDIRVGVPLVGGLDVGDADVMLGDAGLELRGVGDAVRPFLQLGVGVARYRVRHELLDIESNGAVWVGGAGIDMAVSRSLGLRLLARDHVGAPDLREALLLDVEGRTSHNLSFSVGLAFGF